MPLSLEFVLKPNEDAVDEQVTICIYWTVGVAAGDIFKQALVAALLREEDPDPQSFLIIP